MRFNQNGERSQIIDIENDRSVTNALRATRFLAGVKKCPVTKRAYTVYGSGEGVLLLRRSPLSRFGANTWEVPGGKEESNRFRSVATTEFFDETGRLLSPDLLVPQDIRLTVDQIRNQLLFFIYYKAVGPAFDPVLSEEHCDAAWAKPSQLDAFNFIHPAVPHIIRRSFLS